jgi:hypothetical protein
MAITYEPIATTTLSSAASSITFSSIPGTYTDLILIQTFPNGQTTGPYTSIQFNGDTGSNYSTTYLTGYTNAESNRTTNASYIRMGVSSYLANAICITNIMNYSNTTTYKTVIGRNNFGAPSGGMQETQAQAGLWRSTSAITSIVISRVLSSTDFVSGCTFTLYGIKAA